MNFFTTTVSVLVMMAYAIPGYILVKTKLVKGENISAFAMVLLYVCQPCLQIYSFNKANYTRELFEQMSLVFVVSALLQIIMLSIVFFMFRNKPRESGYRICTLAATFGNVGFLGVPLLEALLPQFPDAIAFSAVFIVSMNILSWTLGSYMLTGKKEYISIKKLVLNPPVLSLIIALPLFFTCTKLPIILADPISLVGKMTTPLCMIILGMRLATSKPKELFCDHKPYLTAAFKLIAFPLISFAVFYFLPLPQYVKITMYILSCCPTASVVLNLSEIYGSGQKIAANLVLTSTIFSILTIPLMLLLI